MGAADWAYGRLDGRTIRIEVALRLLSTSELRRVEVVTSDGRTIRPFAEVKDADSLGLLADDAA